MSDPLTWHVRQFRSETIPIGWEFTQSVDGGTFELEHSVFGTFTLTGVGSVVEFPISEELADTAAGAYWYVLTVNPGVVGEEQIAARGHWLVLAREPE